MGQPEILVAKMSFLCRLFFLSEESGMLSMGNCCGTRAENVILVTA